MKALVYRKYGSPDVLKFEDLEKPVPRDHEVLVKIEAASVNAADWHLLTADIFLVRLMAGLFRPRLPILGADLAGTVEAVGRSVRRFQPGDEVFGNAFGSGSGSFAEYTCVDEGALAPKPRNLSCEEAAAVPLAAVTALQGLRDRGGLKPGQSVVIQGSAGGVGTFAVQLARHFGAEVTAVCGPGNLAAAKALGADHVVDYTREDFTRNGKKYDLILGVNGFHSLGDYRRALAPRGVYVMAGGSQAQMFQSLLLGPWMSRKTGKKLLTLSAKPNLEDLLLLRDLAEAGKIVPVIDRVFPLAETAEALRYLGTGHARGKVVISVGREG